MESMTNARSTTSDIADPSLAAAGGRRVEWAEQFMPVLRLIRDLFAHEPEVRGARRGRDRTPG